jgi:hypothetical protein
MSVFIPTFPDVPNYKLTTNLDGTLYQLQFRYSGRESCFYVDLSLNDGTLLVGGRKVLCSVSLWARYRYNPLVPQGHMGVTFGAGGSDEPPNLGELGLNRRCAMFYFSKSEIGG